MPVKNRLRLPVIIFLICSCCSIVKAQDKKHRIPTRKVDTTAMEMNSRISDSILQETEIKDTTIPYMVNKVESYSFSLNRAENFFDRKIDTTGLVQSLSGMERRLNFFHNRLERNENPMNLRNLNTASVLLDESRETLEDWEKLLTTYSDQLNNIHQRVRAVKHDSTLLNDSLNTILHGQMRAVYERSLSLDSLIHTSTIKINTLRNRVSINYLLIKDLVSAINDRQQTIGQAMWKQEEAPFFESCASDYDSSFVQVIQGGLNRSVRVVRIFMRTTWDIRLINLAIWILLMVWFLVTLRVVSKKVDGEGVIQNLTFLKKSAIISSLLLLTTYGPFIYASAPAVYVHLNELLRLLFLSILLYPYLTRLGRSPGFALLPSG